MKHKAFRWIPAILLAALLAGCGARAAASARPDSSRELKSTPPDSMHATAAITEQHTLEKVVQAENGGTIRLNIHLPRLESDSADAARINAEIAQYYEYDVQEYADCPEAADPESWDICIEMNWNASWYGDCVSLVVSSCYGSTDAAAQEVNVPSCISCYLGVTEPAMFGVNLKFHFPFICGMIGSAIAAVVCVATSTTANAIGVGGIPGILSIQPAYMLSFALCMAIAIVVPFALTVIVGKKKGVA